MFAADAPGVVGGNDRQADDELREAEVVKDGDGGYALTRDGQRLLEALAPLDTWARRWARRTKASTLRA